METKNYRETDKFTYFIKLFDGIDEKCDNGIKLNQADKLIYSAFYSYCELNHSNTNEYSNDTYSIITKTNYNQPSKSFKKLEEAGLIEIERTGNKRILKRTKRLPKDATFIKIYTSVLNYNGLTINEKIVYSVIHTLSEGIVVNGVNVCKGSNEMIAERAGCTKRTVINSITRLEELGLIEIAYDESRRKRDITISVDLWDKDVAYNISFNKGATECDPDETENTDTENTDWDLMEEFFEHQFPEYYRN